MTLREQILAQFATVLAPVANVTVYRSRQAAVSRAEGNALIVQPENETPQKRTTGLVVRDFVVMLVILTRGDIPDQIADSIVEDGHARIMADPTLGGLCSQVIEHSSEWKFEQADLSAGELTVRYSVRFQTAPNSLSVAL